MNYSYFSSNAKAILTPFYSLVVIMVVPIAAHAFPGCTDSNACNFNPFATVNDLSCVYPAEGEECPTDCIHPVNGDEQCYFDGIPNFTTCNNPVYLADAAFGVPGCTEVTVYVTANVPGATVQPGDLQAVFVALEHECAYDLHMELISPDGLAVLFCDLPSLPCPDFGIPAADGASNPVGQPGSYFWSMTGTNPDTVLWPIISYPSGAFLSENDLDAFVGSPIDGVWTIRFCDQIWDYDGYVFHAQPVIANSSAERVSSNACSACSHPEACNYLPNISAFESNCIYPGTPCDDGNPATTLDLLSTECLCVGEVVQGCTFQGACNYNPLATIPLPCLFDGDACNDNDPLTFNDTLVNCECQGQPLANCTDSNACNYNPDATFDDGNCIYPESSNFDCDGNCLLYQHPTIGDCAFGGPHRYTCTEPIFIPDNSSTNCLVLTQNVVAQNTGTVVGNSASSQPRIFLNIEHTWLGDLDITLTAPNGTSVPLYLGVSSATGNLGEPIELPGLNGPNIGYDYLLTPDPGNLPWSAFNNEQQNIPSGVYRYTGASAFSGSPLEGVWTLTICDTEEFFYGYLWAWQVFMAESLPNFVDPVDCNGCTDLSACNYDPLMTTDDGSCTYLPVFPIQGNSFAVTGEAETYTYPFTEGSTYLWSAVDGTILSGQGSNEVTVSWLVGGQRAVCLFETAADGCQSPPICKTIDVEVSINEANTPSRLNLYPNPTSTTLTVEVPTSSTYLAAMHDASGRRVREWQLNGTTVISTADLAPGMYTFIVGNWRERIVIVR